MNGKVGKMKKTKLVNGAFTATETEIKALVAEIAEAEEGIAEHRARIMTLATTLIVALYHLGRLLLSMPGASANLKQARGAWLRKAVELCATKSRVYQARDVFDYFDDPFDPDTRASGATGAERAAAFGSNLSELERLIRYKKDDEAEKTKWDRKQRERQAAEAAKAVGRAGKSVVVEGAAASVTAGLPEFSDLKRTRESAAIQGATARIVPPPDEKDDKPIGAEAHEPESGLVEDPTRLEPEAQAEPNDKTENRDIRAVAASDFIGLFGDDVQQAVAYLIESHWNKAAALAWVTAWASAQKNLPRPGSPLAGNGLLIRRCLPARKRRALVAPVGSPSGGPREFETEATELAD